MEPIGGTSGPAIDAPHVYVFVSCQSTVDELSQQIRERQLSVLAALVAHDVFDDERTQSQRFIPIRAPATDHCRKGPAILENRPQGSVEGELKGPVLLLTHFVEASAEFVLLLKRHEYWR